MSEENAKRNPRTTAVEIYGHTYNIRSEGGSEHILSLARSLDERMREISAKTLIGDSVKIAILAALNFTDELHRLKEIYEQQELQMEAIISECSEVLDQALSSGEKVTQASPEPRRTSKAKGTSIAGQHQTSVTSLGSLFDSFH